MDEQQIISDILDSLYGYEKALKDDDPEVIKAKKKEKEEKTEDIVTQINNICKSLENELKDVMGSDIGGMRKSIKLQVLTAIKAEIDNGNNVIDSNGKISVGKASDIIKQSKKEILDFNKNEKYTHSDSKENISMINQEKQDDFMKDVKEKISDMGISLSTEAISELEKAIKRVNEFTKTIKEKVDSGMSENEAIDWYFDQMSKEEQEEFMAQLELAGKYELANLLHQEQRQEDHPKEDQSYQNGETKKEGTELSDGEAQGEFPEAEEGSASKNASAPTHRNHKSENANQYYNLNLIENAFVRGIERDVYFRQNHYQREAIRELEQKIIGKSSQYYEIIEKKSIRELYGEVWREGETFIPEEQIKMNVIGSALGTTTNDIYDIRPSSKEEILSRYHKDTVFFLTHEHIINQIEQSHVETENIIRKSTFASGDVSLDDMLGHIQSREKQGKNSYQFIQDQPEAYIKPIGLSIEKEERLTDELLEEYIERESEDLFVEEAMRDGDGKIIETEDAPTSPPSVEPITPSSVTPSAPPPISIVEEITVDDSGVTQGDSNESSKKGKLSVSEIKALVESQAEVRKMLNVNEIIHGKMPNGPTVETPSTQGTSVEDKDEKSGGEPEEH